MESGPQPILGDYSQKPANRQSGSKGSIPNAITNPRVWAVTGDAQPLITRNLFLLETPLARAATNLKPTSFLAPLFLLSSIRKPHCKPLINQTRFTPPAGFSTLPSNNPGIQKRGRLRKHLSVAGCDAPTGNLGTHGESLSFIQATGVGRTWSKSSFFMNQPQALGELFKK